MKLLGYQSAVNYILDNGYEFGDTRARFFDEIEFDLSAMENQTGVYQPIFIPETRTGHKPTSLNYAFNEAVWYMMRTRDPEYIVKYAKLWDQMRDENGMVNSNYGYQISHNNNIFERIDELARTKRTTFMIVSEDNYYLQHDTVCNNVIDLHLHDDKLNITVTTRSLDLTFGLPYDMFAAQAFGYMILRAFKRDRYKLGTLTFRVVNMHIYERDINEHAHIEKDSFIVVPFEYTPYCSVLADLDKMKSKSLEIAVNHDAGVMNSFFDAFNSRPLNTYLDTSDSNEISDWLIDNTSSIIDGARSRKLMKVIGKEKIVYMTWTPTGIMVGEWNARA